MIDAEFAAAVARTALDNVTTEYPYKLDQTLSGDSDLLAPRELHPVFYGSYDWHSCVHMHWSMVRLLRVDPRHRLAATTQEHLGRRFTARNIQGELATLRGPHRASFERPYGWAWLLKLAAELHSLAAIDHAALAWRDAIAPLAQAFADRFVDFLPRATYPTRAGTHGNSAFALLLARDFSDTVQHLELHRLIVERANLWFGHDRRYPADYEPGGDDFLSSGLVEAALMRRVIDGSLFTDWWKQFQPAADAISGWLEPATVSDASDPKIVHLHGLNLSRAWCWRQLLPELDPQWKALADAAIKRHLKASLPAITQGAYVGTHWLASFALLALTEQ